MVEYPGLGLLGRHPRRAGIHRPPPPTSPRCKPAVPLGHVVGSPDLRLLRGLRHVLGPSADGGPARHRPGWPAGRATPGRFPRSPRTGRRGWCPAIPLQHRPGATATLPGASTPGSDSPTSRWAPWDRARQALPRPRSARFGAVDESRGFDHWFSFLAPSRLACGPGPSGSADPSLRCQDCSRLPPHLRGSAALSFIRPLRRPVVGLAPHPVTRRLVAHSRARR
jgi:hypothetical protein